MGGTEGEKRKQTERRGKDGKRGMEGEMTAVSCVFPSFYSHILVLTRTVEMIVQRFSTSIQTCKSEQATLPPFPLSLPSYPLILSLSPSPLTPSSSPSLPPLLPPHPLPLSLPSYPLILFLSPSPPSPLIFFLSPSPPTPSSSPSLPPLLPPRPLPLSPFHLSPPHLHPLKQPPAPLSLSPFSPVPSRSTRLSSSSDRQQRSACYSQLHQLWSAVDRRLHVGRDTAPLSSHLSSLRTTLDPYKDELRES